MQTMYITQRVTQLNLPPPLGRTALPLLDAVLKTKEEYIMQKRAARRGTRALAFLLCLLMVVSLLPVMGASAAEGDVTAEGVKLNKSLTLESDGTYTITLEAYATGTVTSTTVTEPVPTDFVLVLDQSGSMADNITSYTYTARTSWSYSYSDISNNANNAYYYKDGDAYYQVKRGYTNQGWGTYTYYLYYTNTKDNVTYYLSGSEVTTTQPTNVTDYDATIWTGVLYTRTQQSTQTKLAALKEAVNRFVASVQNQRDLSGQAINHRIAIVGFAYNSSNSYSNTELFIGSNSYTYGSKADAQYSNALQDVTNSAESQNLTNSINALTASGGTYPQYGLDMAIKIFDARRVDTYQKADGTSAQRGKVVVMFTDGVPAGNKRDPSDRFSTDNTTEANATITKAKTLKENGAKVFTIGVYDDTPFDDITTFMNATSSNYPNASSMTNLQNKDSDKYYALATDSEALNNAFQNVSSSVNSSSTSCELDDDSVLTDVISDNLDLPEGFNEGNVTVSTAPCTGKDENDNPIFGDAASFDEARVDINGKTVNVSGFDYSNNYVTGAANEGQKLIVTITGLLPNQDGTGMPSNETTSGIYNDGNLVAPFEVPTFDVASRNVVLDFSMTANIANVAGVKGNERVSTNTYGEFTYGSNDLTYTLGKRVESGNLVFDGIDSALYYGHAYGDNTAQNAWTKVNVIPANNVYFDDDLLTEQSTFTDSDYGYDANVPAATDTTPVQPETGETMAVRAFTFTGSRIDLYCTTDSSTSYVTAALWTPEAWQNAQSGDTTATPVAAQVMNDVYKSGTLYNVPTLSFDVADYNLTRGTYVLVIYAGSNANYQLDGVRVYNPADEDNTTVQDAYSAENEANAQFLKVRDLLLNAGSLGTVEGTPGVVYVDTLNGSGNNQANIDDYTKVGPKNEVYLANGNAIAFKVDDYQNGMKVMVGLSAPEDANSQVTMSNGTGTKEQNVQSYIDMYYEVTPNTDGYVVIENTGDSLISVTNVKISGTAGDAAATLSVDDGLLTYMASFNSLDVTEPDAEPDPTPDTTPNQTTITATINAIWNRVMNGIAKLFGRL